MNQAAMIVYEGGFAFAMASGSPLKRTGNNNTWNAWRLCLSNMEAKEVEVSIVQ